MTAESQGDKSLIQRRERFVAASWLRANADEFLRWTEESGVAALNTATMREAIATVVHPSYPWDGDMAGLASCLPKVLHSCDNLEFSSLSEATAYAGLHLLDRYGRVTRVLEHLARAGRLPIRKRAVKVLEVGAGPAPALYAVRDFYSMFRAWPQRAEVEFADVELAHSIERGEAWDRVLHRISEHLMLSRSDASSKALPFSRTYTDFSNFSVLLQRKQDFENRTQSIFWDFLDAGEPVSMGTARRLAYEEGSPSPSGYDLIFMCNFLTQPAMTAKFDKELRQLARDLTPGGVLTILGGTGKQYPSVYEDVRKIAQGQGLTDISPLESFDANIDRHRGEVCRQVREFVHAVLETCDEHERRDICSRLPKDAWSEDVRFELPRYQVLAFVKQGRPHPRGLEHKEKAAS